jgi:hypothetical protein
MKARVKKITAASLIALAAYFAAYYSSVRTMEFNGEHDLIVPTPVYRPFDSGPVQAAFGPAHLIDAAYIRRAHWEPRSVPHAR